MRKVLHLTVLHPGILDEGARFRILLNHLLISCFCLILGIRYSRNHVKVRVRDVIADASPLKTPSNIVCRWHHILEVVLCAQVESAGIINNA